MVLLKTSSWRSTTPLILSFKSLIIYNPENFFRHEMRCDSVKVLSYNIYKDNNKRFIYILNGLK